MILSLDINSETLPSVDNNIFQFEINDLDNKELESVALQLEKEYVGQQIKYSNIGGWHSKTDLFSKCRHPQIQLLRKKILNCAAKILKSRPKINLAWVNINRKGHTNKNHKHSCPLVACYYVVTDDKGGEFVAVDSEIKLLPQSGTLIIFSGNMYHEVLEYLGDHHRISIACNIN